MNALPLISVIITTYNSEKTIERTLRSVFSQIGLGQAFKFEVLICDDLSTDNTLEVVKQWPVTILSNLQHAGGPNAGRNMGICNSKGSIITFIDHDDEWYPDKTSMQLHFIDEMGYDLAFSGNVKAPDCLPVDLYVRIINWDFYGASGPTVGTIMAVKSDNFPLFEVTNCWHDFDWKLKLALRSEKQVEVPPVMKRNETGNNLHNDPRFKKTDFELIIKHIVNKKASRRLYQSQARYYYKTGMYEDCRYCLMLSNISIKNLGYFITSFFPIVARIIVKKFNVWG